MHEIAFNWLAILAALVLRMVVGAAWYSPVAFGPAFMRLAGLDQQAMRARMPLAIASDLVGGFILTFILVHAVVYAGATTWAMGLAVGLLNWFGFVAVTQFALVMYEKRPLPLFLINNAYQALTIGPAGAILAAWR